MSLILATDTVIYLHSDIIKCNLLEYVAVNNLHSNENCVKIVHNATLIQQSSLICVLPGCLIHTNIGVLEQINPLLCSGCSKLKDGQVHYTNMHDIFHIFPARMNVFQFNHYNFLCVL